MRTEIFSRGAPEPTPVLDTEPDEGVLIGDGEESRHRSDCENLLLNELNHRLKNLLMVIQVIAAQTFRQAASCEGGMEVFSERLKALGHAQDLILSPNGADVSLWEALETAIAGSGNASQRFEIAGPALKIRANHVLPVTLAIHELCTNSMKYGALSKPDGKVRVDWRTDVQRRNVFFVWREIGGPPVAPPTRRGFGSTLLLSNLARALRGEVSLDFPPEGLVFQARAPLSDINRSRES